MGNLIKKKMMKVASEYKAILEKELGNKVRFSYIENERLIFHVYSNEYDYKVIYIKYKEDEILDIANIIKYALTSKKYTEHIASAEEIFISNLIKEYGTNNLHIFDGELMNRYSTEILSLQYIKTMEFNRHSKILKAEDTFGEKYIIDFVRDEFNWIES